MDRKRPAVPAPDPLTDPDPAESEFDILVPPSDAPWWPDIGWFALTYSGYSRNGGFMAVAVLANSTFDHWRATRQLPSDLDALRSCLFFEQRRWRHLGVDPWPEGATSITEPISKTQTYIRALLDRIHEVSGGQVSGPRDVLDL